MAKELNPNLVSLFRLFIVWLFLFVSFQFGILSRALLERNHLKFELLIPHESSSEIDPISFQNTNQTIFKSFNFECYCIAILDPFCFTYSHLIIDYSNLIYMWMKSNMSITLQQLSNFYEKLQLKYILQIVCMAVLLYLKKKLYYLIVNFLKLNRKTVFYVDFQFIIVFYNYQK